MRRLGKYLVVSELGRGGMGAVYRAHDSVLRREVALKLVDPTRADPHQDVLDTCEVARADGWLAQEPTILIRRATALVFLRR